MRGAKPENEQQTVKYNEIIRGSIREGKAENMELNMEFNEDLSKSGRGQTHIKTPESEEKRLPPRVGKTSSLQKIAREQDDEEDVKRTTRLLKKRARKIRTEEQIN